MNDTPAPNDMIWRTELPSGITRIDLGSPIPTVYGEPQPVRITGMQEEPETATEQAEPENVPVPTDAVPADAVPADAVPADPVSTEAETAAVPTNSDALPEIGKPSSELTEWKPGLGRD